MSELPAGSVAATRFVTFSQLSQSNRLYLRNSGSSERLLVVIFNATVLTPFISLYMII
jgi:hypothetical protein